MQPHDGIPIQSENSIKMEVKPGENKIVVLQRTERSCSFNCVYYTHIKKSIEDQIP